MSWSYRIVKTNVGGVSWFGVHEVYYDDEGKPTMVSQESVSLEEETVDDLDFLIGKIKIAMKQPILNYEDFGK
jgi:hypothetical protein